MTAKRRLPIPTADERNRLSPNRELGHDELRALAADTMASWGLEGMEPDEEIIELIRAFVDGEMSREQMIATAKSWSTS